jgi:hypothetical protein
MATIYAPSTASTYYKKLAAQTAAQPAAAGGSLTPFGGSSFNNASPIGMSTIGQSVPDGSPTIYAPPAAAPTAPTLGGNEPAFMSQQLQGYVTRTPAAGSSLNGNTGGAQVIGQPGAAAPGQPDYAAIIKLLQGQTDAANQANETRYNQLLGNASAFGKTALQQNLASTNQQLANGQQSLVNRGLANSTVVDTTRRGILSDSNARTNAIQESVAGMKNGIIEARTDQAPDLSLYASLLSRPGGAQMANALLAGSMKKTTKKK